LLGVPVVDTSVVFPFDSIWRKVLLLILAMLLWIINVY
jgi:hypothetical protein